MGYQIEKDTEGKGQQICPWYQGDDTRGQLEALLASEGRLDSMMGVDRAVRIASPEEKKDSLSSPKEASGRLEPYEIKRGKICC